MNFIKEKSSITLFIFLSLLLHFMLIFYGIYAVNENKIFTNIGTDNNFRVTELNFETERKKSQKQKITKTKRIIISKKNTSYKVSKNNPKTTEEISDVNKIPTINNSILSGSKPSPHYPRRSLLLKQEGKVILKALVDDKGDVLQVTIISSSGFALLDKSAESAIKKWKFNPIIKKGQTSMVWVKIPVEFAIS
jgi:TonB family protein